MCEQSGFTNLKRWQRGSKRDAHDNACRLQLVPTLCTFQSIGIQVFNRSLRIPRMILYVGVVWDAGAVCTSSARKWRRHSRKAPQTPRRGWPTLTPERSCRSSPTPPPRDGCDKCTRRQDVVLFLTPRAARSSLRRQDQAPKCGRGWALDLEQTLPCDVGQY